MLLRELSGLVIPYHCASNTDKPVRNDSFVATSTQNYSELTSAISNGFGSAADILRIVDWLSRICATVVQSKPLGYQVVLDSLFICETCMVARDGNISHIWA